MEGPSLSQIYTRVLLCALRERVHASELLHGALHECVSIDELGGGDDKVLPNHLPEEAQRRDLREGATPSEEDQRNGPPSCAGWAWHGAFLGHVHGGTWEELEGPLGGSVAPEAFGRGGE